MHIIRTEGTVNPPPPDMIKTLPGTNLRKNECQFLKIYFVLNYFRVSLTKIHCFMVLIGLLGTSDFQI